MKKRNLVIVLALILLVLTSFSWNPLVGEGLRIEVTYQLKETFSGLFGGTGLLTPAKLISAATVVVMVWIVNIVVCWILEQIGKKNQRSLSVIGLFTSLCKFICVIWRWAIFWFLPSSCFRWNRKPSGISLMLFTGLPLR